MTDNSKTTEKSIPEPPKFNVNDLPEPPKLDVEEDVEVKIPNQKEKEINVPDPVMSDHTDSNIIPPPVQETDKMDELSPPVEEVKEEVEDKKADDVLTAMPAPPKEEKKKGGFFSNFFKKKSKEEKVSLEPSMPSTNAVPEAPIEPVQETKPVEENPLSDNSFAPPGMEPEPVQSSEMDLPSIESDENTDWFKEGSTFLETNNEEPKLEETSDDWAKEGEQFLEKEELEEAKPFLEEEKEIKTPLTKVKHIGPKRAKKFKKAGIKTAEHVAKHTPKKLAKKVKIPEIHAKKIVQHAKKITKIKQRIKETKAKHKDDISQIVKQLEEERTMIDVMQKKGEINEDKILELEGHKDLINVLQKLEKKRNELVKQESELAEKEKKLTTHDDNYKRDLEHIEKLKRRLDYDIRERTQYLINLEKEYFQKAQVLAKKQSDVDVKEKTLTEKENYLKDREGEIKKKLNDIEDTSITLETKEQKFDKIMKDLEKQDQVLREKEDDLMKREEEYLLKLETLETHEKSILKTLEEKRLRLQAKEKELDLQEKRLHKKQRNVDKKSVAAEYAQNILEEEKSKVLDDQFEQYIADQLGGLKTTSIGMGDMNIVKNLSVPNLSRRNETIYQLIDTCKDMLRNHKLSEAKVFYNQLRERYYDQKFQSQKEKEAVHNMIRSLYDEINLADIGRNR